MRTDRTGLPSVQHQYLGQGFVVESENSASQGEALFPARNTQVGSRCESMPFLLTSCHQSFSRVSKLGTLSSQPWSEFQERNCAFYFSNVHP